MQFILFLLKLGHGMALGLCEYFNRVMIYKDYAIIN